MTSLLLELNLLSTSIYIACAQMETGPFATLFISTGAFAVTRAADDFEEVDIPLSSMADALGGEITTSYKGHPLAGSASAAMSRLNIEEPAGLKDWGAELIFTS